MDNLAQTSRADYPNTDAGVTEGTMHQNRRQPTDSQAIQETLSRARRIETRVTQMLLAMGCDTEAQKPHWDPTTGVLHLPSPHTALKECLAAIPKSWTGAVKLSIGNELVGVLDRAN